MIIFLPDREIPVRQNYSALRAGQHKICKNLQVLVLSFQRLSFGQTRPFHRLQELAGAKRISRLRAMEGGRQRPLSLGGILALP